MKTNAFCTGDKYFSAGDDCVENVPANFTHTATIATSDFQTDLTAYVEMIATHRYSPLKTGSFTLSYSPPSTLQPQAIHTQ